jgi:hypothetical protein
MQPLESLQLQLQKSNSQVHQPSLQHQPYHGPPTAPMRPAMPQVSYWSPRGPYHVATQSPMYGQSGPYQSPVTNFWHHARPPILGSPWNRAVPFQQYSGYGSHSLPRGPYESRPQDQTRPPAEALVPDFKSLQSSVHELATQDHVNIALDTSILKANMLQGSGHAQPSEDPSKSLQSRSATRADDESGMMRGGGRSDIEAFEHLALKNLVRESTPDHGTVLFESWQHPIHRFRSCGQVFNGKWPPWSWAPVSCELTRSQDLPIHIFDLEFAEHVNGVREKRKEMQDLNVAIQLEGPSPWDQHVAETKGSHPDLVTDDGVQHKMIDQVAQSLHHELSDEFSEISIKSLEVAKSLGRARDDVTKDLPGLKEAKRQTLVE